MYIKHTVEDTFRKNVSETVIDGTEISEVFNSFFVALKVFQILAAWY